MSIFSRIDSAAAEVEDPGLAIWEEDPVDLKTFVESPEYLGLDPLSPRQYFELNQIVSDDPKNLFSWDRQIKVLILLFGKGSGKDYMCSILQAYVVYILLCMEDPQKYFGFGKGEALDILNVAHSSRQAKNVYFGKFRQRILGSRWFKENYTVYVSGRKESYGPKGTINIGTMEIQFPKNIFAYSESSENESFEGYNIVFFVCDELSAFMSKTKQKNARRIFNTLRTSASSRQTPWVGTVISFPRQENDVTIDLYLQAKESGQMYSSFGFPWEVKPARFFRSGEYFDYGLTEQDRKYLKRMTEKDWPDIVKIPVEMIDDFKDSPENSKTVFLCIPPKVEDSWFQFPGRIDLCIDKGRKPIFDVETKVEVLTVESGEQYNYIKKYITEWRLFSPEARTQPRVVHVDAGEKECSGALTVGHAEPFEVEGGIVEMGVVEDAHIIWKPDPEKNLSVDISNIEDILEVIAQKCNLRRVTWDHWNSATAMVKMRRLGVTAERLTISPSDYSLMRNLAYAGKLRLYDDPEMEEAMKKLINGTKGPVGSEVGVKDPVDSLVGVCIALVGEGASAIDQRGFPKGQTAGGGLAAGKAIKIQPALPDMSNPVGNEMNEQQWLREREEAREAAQNLKTGPRAVGKNFGSVFPKGVRTYGS